jgi:predicted DNA-binding transcriptional regulator AlpA
MTIDNPITLSAEAAAKLLGLATSTLAKLRLSGNGPVYCKLGRRVVYRREDLEGWLESRVARNTSDADARLPKRLTGERAENSDGGSKIHAAATESRPSKASPRPVNTDSTASKTRSKGSTSPRSATRKS